jgi:hypothetical protein
MNIEEHEQKIKELNEKYIEGTLSRENVQKAISELLNETNLAFRLRDRLLQAVNGQISPKAKERLGIRQYLLKVEELEQQVIESSFPYVFFNEECTVEEIRDINLDVIDQKTLMWLTIEALKGFVNNELADDPKALTLHALYLKLKKALMPEIPFEEGDGFLEFVASKGQRAELEKTRETGTVCLKCGSHNIASKGKEWQCRDCGKRFRKH